LCLAELAGCGMIAPTVVHQLFMDFTNQSQRQRQGIEPVDSIIQGCDIIANLPKVIRAAIHDGPGIICQQFPEGCLGSLDSAGQHGFAFDEGPYQQVRIRQLLSFSGQLAYQAVCIGQRAYQRIGPVYLGRKRVRDERLVTGAFDIFA